MQKQEKSEENAAHKSSSSSSSSTFTTNNNEKYSSSSSQSNSSKRPNRLKRTQTSFKVKVFNIGQLVDFQWKLGVSVSSNHSQELNVPFISVFIKVLNSNNDISSHSFELTVPEFQDFAQQFKDIDSLMNAL
ncbi:COMM domain-containing protein 6 [Cavenderia fasciculata]|uniref:COMM domain-containing protein 6 n=1 Tax=Cavenderia fasciculata TaxID=261658 RepID=F4Q9K2_CACFS|nr:COMM domain-containing protein 6 [Cavenderia fasciculata]EGG15371.1 COMM domain-containing protein 6 [Cavenderia fasciculata]|eukprot:XP_004354113.1 COMM domain-containing protein 6 [Cavenderia fasciculata]